MLAVALERAGAAMDARCAEEANGLLDDVEAALARPPAALAAVGAETSTISALKPPRVSAGNPYLERLVAGAREELATPDKPWAKSTETACVFEGLGGGSGSREVAERMEALVWLFANPASPLKGNPGILAHLLRRAHAYTDAMEIFGKSEKIKAGAGIFDDFAIAPASCALREWSQLRPGLLLPSQKAQWDRAMKYGAATMWIKAKDRQGDYANIDIALAFELLNFGLYLKNPDYLAKSKFLAEVQEKNLYPDGAIAYLGHQNESNNYHNADAHYLARIWEVSGNPKVLELLRRTEWFGPVTSGKLSEFWTVPSWKDTWNASESPAGGEPVASITGNAYLRGMCDRSFAKKQGLKGWFMDYAPLPWFRNDVKPLPLPDRYTIFDRNIAGPRAWYGRFNYAATLRPIPETEPGLVTLMGAQVTDTNSEIGQVLMGVYPRVKLKAQSIGEDGKFSRQSFAWLTSGLKASVVMGRTFSAVAGSYRLHQYGSSTKGPDSDWNGRQLWLGLPDRIVGLLEVSAAKADAKAFGLEGVLRLGTGGTVNGKAVKIAPAGHEAWRYGDLLVTVLGHNYTSIETPEVPFRLPKFPNTEIRLFDVRESAGTQGATPFAYPASASHWFLVEIRPAWVTNPATVSRIDLPAGVLGFEIAVGPKRFMLLDNPGAADLRPKIATVFAGTGSTLHDSNGSVLTSAPANFTIKPGSLIVIVTSPEAADHIKGWANFQEMVSR